MSEMEGLKMNLKAILTTCLFLASCGSSGSQQDYSIKVFAVNVDCKFAEEVTLEAQSRFHTAGIPLQTDLHCVTWDKSYEFGEDKKALAELSAEFGKGHFIVPKFDGYFDGVANANGSISVAAVGRLVDSAEVMAHEVAHLFGASHDVTNCNIMGFFRCGYDAQFNEKAIEEMR
jgi:hypothetical protein